MPLLKIVQYIPTKDHARFRQTLGVINDFARSLIAEKTEAVLAGKAENKKDIMSILGTSYLGSDTHLSNTCVHVVKANASENPKQRLSDEEMVSQMATFLLAGKCPSPVSQHTI